MAPDSNKNEVNLLPFPQFSIKLNIVSSIRIASQCIVSWNDNNISNTHQDVVLIRVSNKLCISSNTDGFTI